MNKVVYDMIKGICTECGHNRILLKHLKCEKCSNECKDCEE